MWCSTFNFASQIVIYHPTTSNNCNNVVQFSISIINWKHINIRTIKQRHQFSKKIITRKNIVVLILPHIQCLHLMYSKVAWVLISSRTPVRTQVILALHYFLDYLSISYDCVINDRRNFGWIFIYDVKPVQFHLQFKLYRAYNWNCRKHKRELWRIVGN